jgi:tRNA wybutosine-synthesizing protein 3
MFDETKKEYLAALYKPDFSRKGTVDEKISALLDAINKIPNYVTTSSCSGRILLIVVPSNSKKHECEWSYVTHDLANMDNAWTVLNEAIKECKEPIWFKMESAILHVQCKTIEDAQKLIDLGKANGFKRSGIFVTKPERIIVEMIAPDKIETIIAKESRILVTEEYFKVLIEEANTKLNRNHDKINALLDIIKKTGI